MLPHQARVLVAPHLLVEGIEELLARGRARVCGAVDLGAAETAEIQQAFRRTVEHHAHAVVEIDDRGGGLGHLLDRRLVRQEVAAVDRIVQVDRRRIPLALGVDRPVDTPLRADRMAAAHADQAEQVDRVPLLGDPDRRHEPRQPASDDDVARPGAQRRKARTVASEKTSTRAPKTAQMTLVRRRARSPTTAPQVSRKLRRPFARWYDTAIRPTT